MFLQNVIINKIIKIKFNVFLYVDKNHTKFKQVLKEETCLFHFENLKLSCLDKLD